MEEIFRGRSQDFFIPERWVEEGLVTVDGVANSELETFVNTGVYDVQGITFLISSDDWKRFGTPVDGPLPSRIAFLHTSVDIALYENGTDILNQKIKAAIKGDDGKRDSDEIIKYASMRYALLNSESEVRYGRPLVVVTRLESQNADEAVSRIARFRYLIAENIEVSANFDLAKFPPSRWREMDERVIALIGALRVHPDGTDN